MLRVVTIASSENVFLFCVVGFLFRVVAIVSFETGKLIVKEKTLLLLVWGSNRVFCFLFGDGAVCGGGMGLPLLLERIAYCEVEGGTSHTCDMDSGRGDGAVDIVVADI